jgi:tetratricopeptide (TPR) repeat protein
LASDHSSFDNDDANDNRIDDALENALIQNDYISISQLAFQQARRFHQREQYLAAVEYSDVALVAWRAHFDNASDEALALARPTELRMLNAAAAQNLNQGQFATAVDLIQQARRLLLFMPPTALAAATEWNTSTMELFRGDYSRALQHALRALEIYHASGESSLNIPRLQLFIAQIAHSGAAAATAQGASQLVDRYLRVARQHLYAARPTDDSRHSLAVDGNLRLVYSAYSRLTAKNEDRLSMVQSIIPLAHALQDTILEGQIFTSLGDEMANQGREEEALTCYRIAVNTLVSSHAPALAILPWRVLKKDWEFNLDHFASALR